MMMKRNGMMIQKRIASMILALAIMAGLVCVPQHGQAGYARMVTRQLRRDIYQNWDGRMLQSFDYEYTEIRGKEHIYTGATPTRHSDSEYAYIFSGWEKAYSTRELVKGSKVETRLITTYVAQFDAVPSDPNKREITWKDQNGVILKKELVSLDTLPAYSGETPAKASDLRGDYTFSGWSPAVTKVTDNAAYTAQFTFTPARYSVTWENADHTVLKTVQNVEYDSIPSYDGPTPAKAPDAAYSYTFSSWSAETDTENRTVLYTAVYQRTVNQYSITWKNTDGTVLATGTAGYDSIPSYPGETPARASDAMYSYTFTGWTPAVAKVTGPAAYTAAYTAEPRNDFTVTWKDWDGTVLETDQNVAYGAMPVFDGGTPERASDEQYTYTFLGWAPEPGEVRQDTTYTASYLPESRSYTVTWKNWDGEVLQTEELAWGEMPVYAFADPEREPDGQYRYLFSGWDPAAGPVTGNAVYTARFTALPASYIVKFRDEDGITPLSGIADQTVDYGGNAAPPSAPAKDGYRFLGWKTPDGALFDFSKPLEESEDPEMILTPLFSRLYTVGRNHAAAGGNGTGSVTWKGETGEGTGAEITAVEGEQITLTALPEEGSVLSGFSVRQRVQDEYEAVPCTMTGENGAVFTMLPNDVIVTAAFVLSENWLDSLKDENDGSLFHIRSEHDLMLLSRWSENHDMAGQTVQLERNLNMAGLDFAGFPGVFRGTFNGGGHTVFNAEVYGFASSYMYHVAFFWDLEGTVANLTVTGSVEDIGGQPTGGLVGHLREGASVSGCTAIMQADDALVCTQWSGSTVSNCFYGGGDSEYGTRLNTVTGGSDYATGAEAVISDPAGTGMRVIDGKTYFAAGSDVTLTLTAPETIGSYELAGFTCDDGDSRYLAKNDQHTYTVQSISGDLTVSPDYTYQMGLDYENGRYLIRSKADLETLARAVRETGGCSDMTFLLVNSIDFNGAAFSGIAVGTGDSFGGTFDGNGKTISNMVIAGSADHVGFIGQLSGTVENLTLKNCTVIGPSYAAMIAGGGWGGTVRNCRVLGGKVQAEHAGAIYLDSYTNYGDGTNNLYDTDVLVISGGNVMEPGTCGTSEGDRSYGGSDAACVMWTVRFLSGPGGIEMADPQKVANRNAAAVPDVTVLPVLEHSAYTGEWKREDGAVYTFDEFLVSDQITEDTDLFPVTQEEETCLIVLTDGLENGQTATVEAYLSEAAGWAVPACGFTPPAGKEFEGWEYEGLVYEPGQAVALTGEKKLTARWKWIEYSVFARDGEETEEIATAHYGELFEFFTDPGPGQETVSVTCVSAGGTNVEVTAGEEPDLYSFTMPDDHVTLTAAFRTLSYAVTATGLEHGALLVNSVQADLTGEVTAHYGDVISVRPDEGYLLAGLAVTDAALDEVAAENGTFTMPALDVEVVAVIAPVFGDPDFVIPQNTTRIEANAFEGIAATVVEIPEFCTFIGDGAFRDCTQLNRIRIPADCELGTDVFDGCTKVYVFGTAGSPAEDYCSDPAHSNCVFVEDTQD